MPLRNSHLYLAFLLSFLVATTVNALPTTGDCNKNIAAGDMAPSSDAHAFTLPNKTSQLTGHFNSDLAGIGAEFLKPPIMLADSPAPGVDAKPLPAVPGTLFMVLTGFFCVSLVRDRRVWLTALAGVLWAGQAGVVALPQLALHIVGKKQVEQQAHQNVTGVLKYNRSLRLRSDIEGTQYIGLLRHLAGIPKSTMPSPFLPSLRAQRSNLNSARSYLASAQTESKFKELQSAIIKLVSHAFQTRSCLALKAKQPICFSPAFIFAQLPRGPPELF